MYCRKFAEADYPFTGLTSIGFGAHWFGSAIIRAKRLRIHACWKKNYFNIGDVLRRSYVPTKPDGRRSCKFSFVRGKKYTAGWCDAWPMQKWIILRKIIKNPIRTSTRRYVIPNFFHFHLQQFALLPSTFTIPLGNTLATESIPAMARLSLRLSTGPSCQFAIFIEQTYSHLLVFRFISLLIYVRSRCGDNCCCHRIVGFNIILVRACLHTTRRQFPPTSQSKYWCKCSCMWVGFFYRATCIDVKGDSRLEMCASGA